jgi:tetratricopeptide (TPR) repeat protein
MTAERLGWTRSVVNAVLGSYMLWRSRGSFGRAVDYLSRVMALTPNDPRVLLLQCLHEYETGNEQEALRMAEKYLAAERSSRSYPTSLYIIAMLAVLYKMTGEALLADAARGIDQELGFKGPAAFHSDAVLTGLALIAATDDDRDLSETYYRELRRAPRTMRGGLLISTDRLLALLSRATGRHGAASRHFRRALRFSRAGFRPEMAWTLFDYADSLVGRGTHRHESRIAGLLKRAEEVATDLGMVLLLRKIAVLRGSGVVPAGYPSRSTNCRR